MVSTISFLGLFDFLAKKKAFKKDLTENGGDNRDRTDDLYAASVALSQLSYTPTLGSTNLLNVLNFGKY